MVRSTQPTLTLKPARASALWLPTGALVIDAIGGRQYRVVRLVGQGGFGAAYQVVRSPGSKVCVLKVTVDATAWHREAYFGYLLRHVPALVEVHDSFAWAPPGDNAPLYCLVSEFVAEGDLYSYLERNPHPWPETRARREIVRLLRAIARIHESGAVHRDITPRNVFVAGRGVLKLGDFGIALHRIGRTDVAADAFAPRFAPRAIQEGARSWRQADDVHQTGQLFAALLSGIGSRKITAAEVKLLDCSAHAKSVLQRCIGRRARCFACAADMLAAILARPAAPKRATVRSLEGKRIVFTGGLSLRRADARKLARRAGATVERAVSHNTDVVVLGDTSPNWKADEKGQKLLDVDHEAERGHAIALIGEKRFLALVRKK